MKGWPRHRHRREGRALEETRTLDRGTYPAQIGRTESVCISLPELMLLLLEACSRPARAFTRGGFAMAELTPSETAHGEPARGAAKALEPPYLAIADLLASGGVVPFLGAGASQTNRNG